MLRDIADRMGYPCTMAVYVKRIHRSGVTIQLQPFVRLGRPRIKLGFKEILRARCMQWAVSKRTRR